MTSSHIPSEFHEKIYSKLRQVPKGKLTTYKDLAHAAGTKAYRAVGTAMNKNPYAPVVPCHRVVNSNGNLGQYAQGTQKKIQRLKKEGISVKDNKIVNFQKLLHKFK